MMLAYSPGPEPRPHYETPSLALRALIGLLILALSVFGTPAVVILYLRYIAWVWTAVFR